MPVTVKGLLALIPNKFTIKSTLHVNGYSSKGKAIKSVFVNGLLKPTSLVPTRVSDSRVFQLFLINR